MILFGKCRSGWPIRPVRRLPLSGYREDSTALDCRILAKGIAGSNLSGAVLAARGAGDVVAARWPPCPPSGHRICDVPAHRAHVEVGQIGEADRVGQCQHAVAKSGLRSRRVWRSTPSQGSRDWSGASSAWRPHGKSPTNESSPTSACPAPALISWSWGSQKCSPGCKAKPRRREPDLASSASARVGQFATRTRIGRRSDRLVSWLRRVGQVSCAQPAERAASGA